MVPASSFNFFIEDASGSRVLDKVGDVGTQTQEFNFFETKGEFDFIGQSSIATDSLPIFFKKILIISSWNLINWASKSPVEQEVILQNLEKFIKTLF